MRKPDRKHNPKMKKQDFDSKFEQMAAEYREAKAHLDTLVADSDEYRAQQKKCQQLFANAERFVNSQ